MLNWTIKRLDKICSLRKEQVGADLVREDKYVALEHVDSARSSLTRWDTAPDVRSTKARFRKGDILYGKLRPYLDKAAIAPFDGVCSTELLPLVPITREVNPEFLAFLLHAPAFLAHAEATTSGVNHPRTSWSAIASFEWPIPPLEEQSAIGSALKVAEMAIRTQETLAGTLSRLKAITMSTVFRDGLRGERLKDSDAGSIPETWDVVRLGDIAKIGNGSTPNRSNAEYWHHGVFPWITSTKVHEVFIRSGSELVSEVALRECHLPVVPKGSLVVAITGQGKTLGNAALLEIDTTINQHLAYIQVQSDKAVPAFLLFWLQNQYDYFRQVSSGGGSTKGALTCGFISNLLIPLPSREEQEDIAELLLALTRRHQVATKKTNSLCDLSAAMLRELTSGTVLATALESAEVLNA